MFREERLGGKWRIREWFSTRVHQPVGPKVPASMNRASRDELTAVRLEVFEGTLPADAVGHVFFVAPAGTVDTDGLPDPSGNTVMAGDGMVCRVDLDGTHARMTTRLAKTPDLYADQAAQSDERFRSFRFVSSGIARVSRLGARVFANTALVPLARAGEAPRLLVTYDAGRPFELDPVSLELVTPVGSYAEWRPSTFDRQPFPLVLSPAHPAYDPSDGTLFTVNYSRSAWSMFFASLPALRFLGAAGATALGAMTGLVDAASRVGLPLRRRLRRRRWRARKGLHHLMDLVGHLPLVPEDFTELVRWDGEGCLERFRLVLPAEGNTRVAITQSIHQVAVTRRHVVILDTAFKIGPEQGFNDPIPGVDFVDRLFRWLVTSPQRSETTFYVVRREDLKTGRQDVPATRVTLPLEADHFVADYEDEGGIVVHVAHAPATDLAEWVRPYDRSAFSERPLDPRVHGMMAVGAMDLGRIGRYRIDPQAGSVVESEVIADEKLTWALALYAGPKLTEATTPPERVEKMFWVSEGYFEELATRFVWELYDEYPHRLVPLPRLREIAREGGRPCAVLAVQTSGPLRIADSFVMPHGTMIGSLQWVGSAEERGGYLLATVYTMNQTELWMFDGDALGQGPLAKLRSPAPGGIPIGFSLHSAFLPELRARESDYRVKAEHDFPGTYPRRVRELLDEVVIPRFYQRGGGTRRS